MTTQKIFFAAAAFILVGALVFVTFAQIIEKNTNLTTKKPITDSESISIPLQASSSAGNVLWDLTHGIYFGYEPGNRYSNLVTALQGAGYSVTTTTNIGSVTLSSYKVLVINLGSAWNSAYTTTEKSQIQTFVQNGGGLLIMGDNPGTPNVNINIIAQTFGITLGGPEYYGTSITNFAAHPIFTGVTKLYLQWFGELTVSAPASLVAWDPATKGCVSVAQSGSGRVVAIGDINFCENNYLANESNQKFSINIFDWLSGGGVGSKFDFNDGTVQGWTKEGAFDEDGDGPFFNNFTFEWYDQVNFPNAPGKDPAGDKKGSLTLYTWSGHGIPNPTATWWIMRYKSPDLSGSSAWQTAKGYTVEIAECMSPASALYANLYVIVYDKDQAKDRYFYNGTAAPLTHDDVSDNIAAWNHLTFDWSGIATFPTNFTIKNIFINLWGKMSVYLPQGGAYLDEVVAILPATNPDIASNPTSWDYGAIDVGNNSDKTFVIKNEGTANLNVTETRLTGANATEFSIQTGGGSFTLAPGATRDIIIKFAPTSSGNKSAALSISSNDPDENPFLVNLTGSGAVAQPDISVNPTSLDFGTVEANGFQEYSVTVKNEGPGTLNVTGTTLSGTNAGEFSIQSGGGAFSLTTGATRNIVIRFKPASAGNKTAVFNIASNDPDENPLAVNLKGTGVVIGTPDISSTPIAGSYNSVNVGSFSDITFVIRNDGTANLDVTATTLTGTTASEYSIQSGGGAFSLAPGATRDMVVRFSPTSAGYKLAVINISSNDPDENPFLIMLSGTGVAVTGIPINPVATSPQMVGIEFWVSIDVGSNANPVTDLFGVSFDLNYSNTNYINYVASEVGAFIGSDVIFYPTSDDANGKVSIGISRKAPQAGVNGFGTVARVKLIADAATPNNTSIQFSISNVAANNSAGATIALAPGSLTITIQSGVLVWPGDTNNNGLVDQADILPVGLHWGKTGPARQNASMTWTGQLATPWNPQAATYADATGDGTVNQADVLPIGFNWNKTHTGALAAAELPAGQLRKGLTTARLVLADSGSTAPNQDFYLDIRVEGVSNLFGLSYELIYTPAALIDPLIVELGPANIMGNDVIFFSVINDTAGQDSGKVSVGLSRKYGQGGVNGSGRVTRIKAHMAVNAVNHFSTTQLTLTKIQANDPNGNPIPIDSSAYTLITKIQDDSKIEPTGFALYDNYPNPFNSATTIAFQLPQPAKVNLAIYDLQGHRVRALMIGDASAGYHTIQWNGCDDRGNLRASGVYIIRIEAKTRASMPKTFLDSRKMILMK